jgi:crotonobetainyl-CoA:carnitine CoA-transferase CaiB-like acyl-CoA transferase
LFRAQDRPFVIAVGSDAQWASCVAALELEKLANDDRLSTNAGRLAHRERIVKEFSSKLAGAPAAVWQERLARVGVPTGLVKSVREVIADVDASATFGMPPSIGGPPRFPPPRLDEHGSVIRRRGWRVFDRMFGQTDGR